MSAISRNTAHMGAHSSSSSAPQGRKRKLDEKADAVAAERFSNEHTLERTEIDRKEMSSLTQQCKEFIEKNKFTEILEIAKKALNTNPVHKLALYYSAFAHSYLGDHANAVEKLKRIVPEPVQQYFKKIIHKYIREGNYNKADELFKDYLEAHPGKLSESMQILWIKVLDAKERYQEVITEVAKVKNVSAHLRFSRAKAYFEIGRMPEAEEDLNFCRNLTESFALSGKLYIHKNQMDEALRDLRDYLTKATPDVWKMGHPQLKVYYEALKDHSDILYKKENYAVAKGDYQTYLDKAECSAAVRDRVLYKLAVCKFKLDEDASALEDLKKIRTHDEKSISLKGKICLILAKNEEALKEYVELEKINPLKSILGQAKALTKLGRHAQAIENLSKAINRQKKEKKEQYCDLLRMRAETYFEFKDYANAIKDYLEIYEARQETDGDNYRFAQAVFYGPENTEKLTSALFRIRSVLNKQRDYDQGGALLLRAGLQIKKEHLKEAEESIAEYDRLKCTGQAQLKAQILAMIKSRSDAVNLLKNLAQPILPMAPQSNLQAFNERMAKAAAARQAGRNAVAKEIYQKLIEEIKNQNAEIYFIVRYESVCVWIEEGCYTKALIEVEAVLKEKPAFGEALAVRAAMHFIKGNAAQGRKDIAEVFKMNPKHLDIAIAILDQSIKKEDDFMSVRDYESGLRFVEAFKRSAGK